MRIDELSTGRLVELLAQHFMKHDPMPEVAIVPLAVLVELVRRAMEGKEAASTTGP